MDNYLEKLEKIEPNKDGDTFNLLFDEYWKIIIRSLITTFGLDFLIKDHIGGDVDTVHNVRKLGEYKNLQNKQDYENRGSYDTKNFHDNDTFKTFKNEQKGKYEFIDDAYSPGQKIYLGNYSYLKKNNMVGNLDHVVSGKELHDDPGRVLAGLNTNDLGNRKENYKYTNSKMNSQMGSMSKEEYVKKYYYELTPEQRKAILESDKEARDSIDKDINATYYTSEKFYTDVVSAAHNLGTRMGLREAIGFIMVEIIFSCKKELNNVPNKSSFKKYLMALVDGVKLGIANIRKNYKMIFIAFGEGYISGLISSISTTLINVFITTDKMVVKNIRTTSITLVRASNVLFFNPTNLLMGDRLKTTLVILTTGVSAIIGTTIGSYAEKFSNIIPILGNKFSIFIEIAISGLLSCTFLTIMDRSKFMNSLVTYFNKYATASYEMQYYCKQLEEIAAKLNDYDIECYVEECESINYALLNFSNIDDEDKFSDELDKKIDELGIDCDDLDDFLDGKTSNFNI